MRRRLFGGLFVAAVLASGAVDLAAQETGTPMFKAPYRSFTNHEFGAAFSDPGETWSYALEGFYSYGSGKNDFGLRAGIADPQGAGSTSILLGADFRTRVLSYSEDFPLDGALTVGVGANFGDADDVVYLPVGLSVGRRFELEGSKTTFTPYAHPVVIPVVGASGGSDVG
ncbi:MAG TPA: hypothetical protein VIM84_14615, partial [Gemmatimonadales bacterium]